LKLAFNEKLHQPEIPEKTSGAWYAHWRVLAAPVVAGQLSNERYQLADKNFLRF
jgi:hypothetical protein